MTEFLSQQLYLYCHVKFRPTDWRHHYVCSDDWTLTGPGLQFRALCSLLRVLASTEPFSLPSSPYGDLRVWYRLCQDHILSGSFFLG